MLPSQHTILDLGEKSEDGSPKAISIGIHMCARAKDVKRANADAQTRYNAALRGEYWMARHQSLQA